MMIETKGTMEVENGGVSPNNVLLERGDVSEERKGEISPSRPRSKKNQDILIFTCTAFFLFAIAEMVGAVISGSLSLLGDAGAMCVDVFTVRFFYLLSHYHFSCSFAPCSVSCFFFLGRFLY